MFVLVYVVGSGLGMFLGILHCNMGIKMVVLLFLMLVLSGVWVFYSILSIRCMTSSACHLVR